MYSIDPAALKAAIKDNVTTALAEDIAGGDINAALIDARSTATASVLSRQTAVVCGTDWVDEVFRQIDPAVQVNWQVRDGDRVNPDDVLLTLNGKARALLSGERVALNFLQLLSAIATKTAYFVEKVTETHMQLKAVSRYGEDAGFEIRPLSEICKIERNGKYAAIHCNATTGRLVRRQCINRDIGADA